MGMGMGLWGDGGTGRVKNMGLYGYGFIGVWVYRVQGYRGIGVQGYRGMGSGCCIVKYYRDLGMGMGMGGRNMGGYGGYVDYMSNK